MQDLESRLKSAKIYLNNHSPFFSTLINNTKISFVNNKDPENSIATAATNGREILLNEDFISSMSDLEFCGLISHEVLHMALAHVYRFKSLPKPPDKSPEYYSLIANYAADIIVNGIITKCSDFLKLPQGGIFDSNLEHLSFPEVYAELLKDPPIDYQEVNICFAGDNDKEENEDSQKDSLGATESQDTEGMEEMMKELLEQAKSAEEMYGDTTSSLYKHIKGIDFDDHTDYKSMLSRFIISARNAWGGYDRRFIYQDLYFDDSQNDELNLNLFIDSSGSVDEKKLAEFISCVEDYLGLSNWADIKRQCFFFDTELYGPFDTFSLENIQGFGGTNFFPIIDKIKEIKYNNLIAGNSIVNIIYTDGYSEIPECKDESMADNTFWILNGSGVKNFLAKGWKSVYQLLE